MGWSSTKRRPKSPRSPTSAIHAAADSFHPFDTEDDVRHPSDLGKWHLRRDAPHRCAHAARAVPGHVTDCCACGSPPPPCVLDAVDRARPRESGARGRRHVGERLPRLDRRGAPLVQRSGRDDRVVWDQPGGTPMSTSSLRRGSRLPRAHRRRARVQPRPRLARRSRRDRAGQSGVPRSSSRTARSRSVCRVQMRPRTGSASRAMPT